MIPIKIPIRKSGGLKCGQTVMADCSHSWTWNRLSYGTLLNDVFHESQTNSPILDEDRSETTIYVPSFASDQCLWYSGFVAAIVGRIATLIRMALWEGRYFVPYHWLCKGCLLDGWYQVPGSLQVVKMRFVLDVHRTTHAATPPTIKVRRQFGVFSLFWTTTD